MKLVLVAAAVAVATVPGAAARSMVAPQLLSAGPLVISPNRNGVNDALHLHVSAPARRLLGLRAYVWGGRLLGWRRVRTGLSLRADAEGAASFDWAATKASGRTLSDGSYVVTVCYTKPGRRLPAAGGAVRPGAAEASVRRPPWRRPGCLAQPKVVRVERLAAWVDSISSYAPGARVPLQVSADHGQASVVLQQDCSGARIPYSGTLPHVPSGLYHFLVRDPWGDEFHAPVVVRNGAFPVDRPPPKTALLVWPYLTWRAYNAYDADLDGRPDSWYQFWRQRRVSLVGTILPGGVEDDHGAALPFSRWLCSHRPRVESITDVELGRLPLDVLRRYTAVVYPGHSEYYEPQAWDLLRRYRDGGGHLIVLQANPFYRQVRVDRAHNAVVLTDFDAREGRSDFGLTGVGYDGCCFPRSRWVPYVAARGAAFRRVAWLFAGTGIRPGAAFGITGGEVDRVDPALTPRDHVAAAEAVIAGKHGVVNSDLVWARAGRGEVLASGNYRFLRMPGTTPSGLDLSPALLDNIWRKMVG